MQKIIVIISVVMVLWSCQTEPDNLKLFDELVVSTNFDPETTFSAYTTYAIPTDTIGFVSEYRSERYYSGCSGLIITFIREKYWNRLWKIWMIGCITAWTEMKIRTWV